jgi:arylformamidase
MHSSDSESGVLPTVKVLHDIPYGDDSKQRMDVYLPQISLKGAPVIFMVHGGAWAIGDKSSQAVVVNKVAKWVPRGFIFISVNYRLVPEADPLRQADDVAHALATAQDKAATWGGDPSRFILMGHSTGAHLVALLAAAPSRVLALGAKPWLGTVMLDSAAYDLVQIMQARHPRFYDKAFGSRPDFWRSASPYHVLTTSATPMLAVCSSRRDDSCPQAHKLAERAASLKVRMTVVEEDLSHRQINETLGQAGDYTEAVDKFISSLVKQ